MSKEDRIRWMGRAAALVAALLCLATLRPFLEVALWGAIIAVGMSPMAERAERVLGSKKKAALAVCVGLLLIVALPLGFAAVQAVEQLSAAVEWVNALADNPWPHPPQMVLDLPVIGSWLARSWDSLSRGWVGKIVDWSKDHAGEGAGYAASWAGEVGSVALRSMLALALGGLGLAYGDKLGAETRAAARQAFGQGSDGWIDLICSGVRGVSVGVCGTALALAIAVAAGLAAAGIPAVSLLSCVAMFLCLAQIGPLPILGPAGVYLAMRGQYGAAIGIAVLAVVLSVVDGVMRPYLVGREIKMPMSMIFTGVVGGLLSMGMAGLFVGPLSLAIARKLWIKWRAGTLASPQTFPSELKSRRRVKRPGRLIKIPREK